jgi:hypothetical protein
MNIAASGARARIVGLLVAQVLTGVACSPAASVSGAPAAPAPAESADTPSGTAAPAPSADGIPLASAHARGAVEPSAPSAWGGERSGREATLSDRVVDYDIDATLDPDKHTVDGRERLRWRNRSDRTVRAVYLHLYLNAFEGYTSTFFSENRNLKFEFRSEVPIGNGEWGHIALEQVRQGDAAVPWVFVHPDGGPSTDHTVVRLDLPEPVGPGASTTLAIAFHDQLPRVVARTGYFGTFHLVGQWFPKIGVLELPGERGARQVQWNVHEFHLHSEFYADYANFDVRLTVPAGVMVGATGEQQGPARTAQGRSTYHYTQGDVHDFAWTADSRSAPPLEGQYTGSGSPPVQVRVLYPPEEAASAAPVLKATIDALAYFSRTLGPYPYRTVTAVIPPFNADEAGGMEYPTFFTTEGYRDVDPDTLHASALDFVTIHEFGHGYFYGILGSNEFEEPMLDEGLNEYWDMRMMRERRQGLHLGNALTNRLGLTPVIDGFSYERLAAMSFDPSDALGENSWDRYSSTGYGSVYSRTATTLHDLEEAVGAEAMERGFRLYYQRWKFRHPGVADLREALIEGTGQRARVEAAFAQQVYGVQKIDDAVDGFTSEEQLPVAGTRQVDGRWVEVTREEAEQSAEHVRADWKRAHPDAAKGGGPFPWRTTLTLRHRGAAVAQEVVVRFADGSAEQFVWDSPEPWQRTVWIKPVQAVSVEIDPHGRNLLDVDVLNHSRTIEPDASASRRWSADLAALLQSAFSFVAAL